MDDAYPSSWSKLKGVVVEFVGTFGTDRIIGEEEVKLESHFRDSHLGNEGLDEGGFVGVDGERRIVLN